MNSYDDGGGGSGDDRNRCVAVTAVYQPSHSKEGAGRSWQRLHECTTCGKGV